MYSICLAESTSSVASISIREPRLSTPCGLTGFRKGLKYWPDVADKGDAVNPIEVDGRPLELAGVDERSAGSIYACVLEHVREMGRIVTGVRLGGEEVVWNDCSHRWDQALSPTNQLKVTTDLPIRVTAPLLEEIRSGLSRIAADQRRQAERLRETMIWSDTSASLLEPWSGLQLALGQVAALHDINWSAAEWSAVAQPLQSLSRRLRDSLTELKDALARGDLVLSADLLEFELAPLAEEWSQPLAGFQAELQRRFGG